MNKKLSLILVALLLSATLVILVHFPEVKASGVTVLDSYTDSGATRFIGAVWSASSSAVSQAFKTPAGIQYNLTASKFYLDRDNAPTCNVSSRLYSYTGTPNVDAVPSGDILEESDMLNVTSISTTGAWYQFNFTGSYTLTADTWYEIVFVAVEGHVDGSDSLNVHCDASSPTHSGNYAYKLGSWDPTAGGTIDLSFYVYGTPSDADAPTFGTISASNTIAGQSYTLSCTVEDNVAVDYYWFEIDGTNKTAQAFVSSPVTYEDTWTSSVPHTAEVYLYANDTSGNEGGSSLAEFELDYIEVTLAIVKNRIDITYTANITATAAWSNSTAFTLTSYTLNETDITSSIVQRINYTCSSIEPSYVFTSNEIYCIFDAVQVSGFSAVDSRINLSDEATFNFEATYAYDSAPYDGTAQVIGTTTRSTVGKTTYTLNAGAGDPTYPVWTLNETVPDVDVIFDQLEYELIPSDTMPAVNETMVLAIRIQRAYDDSDVTSYAVTLNRDNETWVENSGLSFFEDMEDDFVSHTYNVTALFDSTYGLSDYTWADGATQTVTVQWGGETTFWTLGFIIFLAGAIAVAFGILFMAKRRKK
jgi:hypothetical protein